MRGNLKKKNTTKAERVFSEEMKNARIPFQAKVVINRREVDFLIGNCAIEINGHPQKLEKNKELLEAGFNLVNITNKQVLNNREELAAKIRKICLINQE